MQKLVDLSQNEAYLKMSVAELNGDLKRKVEPLEKEATQIKKRLEEIEQESKRYVRALGQGKLSIGRLEAEISALEGDRQALEQQYGELQRRINESAIRDYNAELLQRTLRDFGTAFGAFTPQEQSEALQCVLKRVTVHPEKLDMEVFELEEFRPGSQNRSDWLPKNTVFQLFLSRFLNVCAGPRWIRTCPAHFAGLPCSRHDATRSETFASPTHITVSAAPQ